MFELFGKVYPHIKMSISKYSYEEFKSLKLKFFVPRKDHVTSVKITTWQMRMRNKIWAREGNAAFAITEFDGVDMVEESQCPKAIYQFWSTSVKEHPMLWL